MASNSSTILSFAVHPQEHLFSRTLHLLLPEMTRQSQSNATWVDRRQILSIPMIALLFTAAMPFSPMTWVLGSWEGAYLIDRLITGPLLLCACYFQWKLSSVTFPVIITIQNPAAQQSNAYVRNGRVGQSNSAGIEFLYNPSNYYLYMSMEVGLLLFAEYAGFEYLRRAIVICVVGALWAVGWTITPRQTKAWAWEHIKSIWFFLALDLARDIGFGGGRRRGGARR